VCVFVCLCVCVCFFLGGEVYTAHSSQGRANSRRLAKRSRAPFWVRSRGSSNNRKCQLAINTERPFCRSARTPVFAGATPVFAGLNFFSLTAVGRCEESRPSYCFVLAWWYPNTNMMSYDVGSRRSPPTSTPYAVRPPNTPSPKGGAELPLPALRRQAPRWTRGWVGDPRDRSRTPPASAPFAKKAGSKTRSRLCSTSKP
jgi:hypothetical protein